MDVYFFSTRGIMNITENTLGLLKAARPKCPSVKGKGIIAYTHIKGRVYVNRVKDRGGWSQSIDNETGEIQEADAVAIWYRVNRLSCQYASTVDETGESFTYAYVDSDEAKKVLAKWRKRKERGAVVLYHSYPQMDGTICIVNNQGFGEEMPSSGQGIWSLYEEIAITDRTRRARASEGFGGTYKGSEGFAAVDGVEKAQVLTSGSIVAQGKMFESAGFNVQLTGNGFVIEKTTMGEVMAVLKKSKGLMNSFFSQIYDEVLHV